MPVARSTNLGTSSNFASAATGTARTTASYTVGINEVAVLSIALPTTGLVNSITDSAGRVWTKTVGDGIAGTGTRAQVWHYVNTSGAVKTGTTTINLAAAQKLAVVIGVYTGVDLVTPIGTTSTSTATGTLPTASLNANAANSMMIGTYSTSGAPTFTVNATDTNIANIATTGGGGATNTRAVQVRDNNLTATAGSNLSTAGTWGNSSNWASVGVELRAAAAAPVLQTLTRTYATDTLKRLSPIRTSTTDTTKRKEFNQLHTTNTVKRQILTQNHTTSASMVRLATLERTHSTNASIRPIPSVGHTTDTAFRKAITAVHVTNVLKRVTGTITTATDSVRRSAPLSSHTTDVVKHTSRILNHTTSSFLFLSPEPQHVTDVLKRQITTVTHTTDAAKYANPILFHATNSSLHREFTRLQPTDTYLRGFQTFEENHHIDTLIRQTVARSFTTSTWKRVTLTSGAGTDALIRSETPVSHSADCFLYREVGLGHTTDVQPRNENIISHTVDVNKHKSPVLAHSTDAAMLRNTIVIKSHVTDSYVEGNLFSDWSEIYDWSTAEYSETHDTDSFKRGTGTLTASTDALKRTAGSLSHATDTSKRIEVTKNHTTNVLLAKTHTRTHATDAQLYVVVRYDITTTTDALKRAVGIHSHVADSYKRRSDALQHATSSFLALPTWVTHTTDTSTKRQFTVEQATDVFLRLAPIIGHRTSSFISRYRYEPLPTHGDPTPRTWVPDDIDPKTFTPDVTYTDSRTWVPDDIDPRTFNQAGDENSASWVAHD